METDANSQYTTRPLYDVSSPVNLYINETDVYGPITTPRIIDKFRTAYAGMTILSLGPLLLCVVGIPGNLASFVTILRITPVTTASGYVAVLAAVDTCSIICKVFLETPIQLLPGGCQVLYFVGSLFSMFANWILVAMAVERFIAIWFPLKVASLISGKKSVGVMVAIALTILTIDLHFLWTITSANMLMDCVFKDEYSYFMKYIWYWIDSCLYTLFPCILLVVFNVLIIVGIRRSGRIQKDLTNNKNDKKTEKFRQERQITIMLIVVSVTLIVLTLPNGIFYIFRSYWTYEEGTYGQAVYMLALSIVGFLSNMNHAINFFLYFLTARRFRRKFTDILCCRTHRRRTFSNTMKTATSNVSNSSVYTTQTSVNAAHREH